MSTTFTQSQQSLHHHLCTTFKTLLNIFLPSGLPSRRRWFPCPAVFSSCRRAIPGSVPRVAACVQRPGQPLRSQVQSQGLGPCGGAGPQGAGWDTLLHRVLGHVHQWSLPGRRRNQRALLFSPLRSSYLFLLIYLLWKSFRCLDICTVLGSQDKLPRNQKCDLDQFLWLRKSEKCIFQSTIS